MKRSVALQFPRSYDNRVGAPTPSCPVAGRGRQRDPERDTRDQSADALNVVVDHWEKSNGGWRNKPQGGYCAIAPGRD